MSTQEDILVVGGGIFGATGALELQARGHRVTLVDQGTLPHDPASSNDISKAIRMDYGADATNTRMMEKALAGRDNPDLKRFTWREKRGRWTEKARHL